MYQLGLYNFYNFYYKNIKSKIILNFVCIEYKHYKGIVTIYETYVGSLSDISLKDFQIQFVFQNLFRHLKLNLISVIQIENF